MSDEHNFLLQTTDAAKWAAEFCIVAKRLGTLVDEGWMITWFANAIETGRAAGERARPAAPTGRKAWPEMSREDKLELMRLASNCWDRDWFEQPVEVQKLIDWVSARAALKTSEGGEG